MSDRSAVLFLLDDCRRTGSETPLMLHRVLGVPLLSWLSHALARAGVSRFCLVCAPALLSRAQDCFPAGAELSTASDESLADRLHVFLSTAPEAERDLLVVTGPVIYAPGCRRPGDARASACMVDRRALMAALDETAPIGHFLQQAGEPTTCEDGFFRLSAPEELPGAARLLRQDLLLSLTRGGVEIWDPENTYVTPGVRVGAGSSLLPGTVLQGKTSVGKDCVIGPNTRLIDSSVGDCCRVEQSRVEGARLGDRLEVGPFANLRPGTVMEAETKAGAFVELKNTSVGAGAKVPHLSYLGDAALGARANVGCGTVTANFDRAEKHYTVIEEEAFLGCNSTLVAPVNVGRGAYVAAGSVVTEDVPPQALAISRPRAQIKKEWALKNKRADS
ncbi:MAG: hypothetical protein IKQ04_09245 [Oscillospiraceae bacterium]|nr:hypothetical protein [Oscillospiraceae bacterium]